MFRTLWQFIGVIGAIVAYVRMKRVKSAVPAGQTVEDSLSRDEKLYIWLLSLVSPVITGLIFYYGWRKLLPQKARSANRISWLALLILLVVFYGLYFVAGWNPLSLPVSIGQ